MWLPLTHPLLETWPATQGYALTRNQASDPLVHRPVLHPLSHTSQGHISSNVFLFSYPSFLLVYNYMKYLFFLSLGFQLLCVLKAEVSVQQVTYSLFLFFNPFTILCVWIGEFSLFTFKVIIDGYVLTIAIQFIVSWIF